MTTPKDQPNAWQAGMELIKGLANLPAPEKVYYELQRFNNNMERIQPDIAKMSKVLEGVNPQDIRNLITALQSIKASEMLLVLRDTNTNITKLYEKIWGKK